MVYLSQSPRALVIAAFDSQLKWAAPVWQELRDRNFQCRVVAPQKFRQLSTGQVAATGIDRVDSVGFDELLGLASEYDVVINALTGPLVHRITMDLADRTSGVSVAGWVGVITERITAGYLDRCAVDVLAVNARSEFDYFVEVGRRLQISTENLLLCGLPILSGHARRESAACEAAVRGTDDATESIQTVLFADQPTVPASPAERLHIYRRLLDYAREHPTREVLLKPRHRRSERTFHRMLHHPEDLLSGEVWPDNFSVVYSPIPELLDRADLLLTMSSTACLEALDRGCKVAFVLDLGVHERYANHVYLDSGLLRTFDQIIADDIGVPDRQWFESWFGERARTPAQMIVDRVEELLESGERPAKAVLDSPYLRSALDLHQRLRVEGRSQPPSPWQRRRRMHGTVKGTAVHLGLDWVPPAVQQPIRRWWRDYRG